MTLTHVRLSPLDRRLLLPLFVLGFGAIVAPMLGADPVQAVCVGDCDGDDVVRVDELVKGVNIALEKASITICPAFDPDSNSHVTVDELITGVNNLLRGCNAPPATPTPAPTLVPRLQVKITNGTGVANSAINISGRAIQVTDSGPLDPTENYDVVLTDSKCSSCGTNCTLCSFPRLVSGTWQHDIRVTSGQGGNALQKQYTTSVLTREATPAIVQWTVFARVLQVNRSDDPASVGACDTDCTLREAVADANGGSTGPVLIQFDRAASQFPMGVAQVRLTQNSELALTRANTVVDGTAVISAGPFMDSRAQPAAVLPFGDRKYPTQITLDPANKAPFGVNSGRVRISAAGITLLGLHIDRILGTDMEVDGKDQDVVSVVGTDAHQSQIINCLLEGGAGTRNPDEGGIAQGKDCVDVEDSTTTSFANAVVVANSELRYCYDRGVKSQDGYVLIRDSWIHNNLRCGVLAQDPNGHARFEHGILENNGKNASGTATRDGAQLTAEAGSTEIVAKGAIIRDGPNQGIFFRNNSTGTIEDSWTCGMEESGVEMASAAGSTSAITIRGLGAVKNGRGIFLHRGSPPNDLPEANFGTTSNPGSNVFTKSVKTIGNPVASYLNFRIDSASTENMEAEGNQWEHCGNGSSCVITGPNGIIDKDVEPEANVVVTSAQPHRNAGTVALDPINADPSQDGVYPRKVAVAGDIVHIHGSGFNAIDGYETSFASCAAGQTGVDACTSPANGTCVEFKGPTGSFVKADIVAITPTYIAVRAPFACRTPSDIRIRVKTASGESSVVFTDRFCRN